MAACSYETAPKRRNAVARGVIQADQFSASAMARTSPRIRFIRDATFIRLVRITNFAFWIDNRESR